ncbi:MAG TPA: hypothetical protein VIC27_14530, partial [Ktedonobacterales bacterium]
MLAQDRKNPHPRKRARQTTVEDSLPTSRVDAAPELPAQTKPPTRVSASGGRRPVVTARPISQNDRRVVATATRMTAIAPALRDEIAAVAIAGSSAPPAVLDDHDAPAAPTIVGGDATSKMVAMRVRPPKRKKRHWASGAVILTLVAATALTAIATVTPLASGHAEGLAVHAAGPLGLPVALDAANRPPSGDWVALIGLQPNQDVGGGAGPGVKAPGSAGLPVTSVQTVVNTGAPSAQQAGA